MWAIMMMAMMLPSAAPADPAAAALMRQRGGDRIFGPTGLFVLGYLLIWFGFSLAATALQWGLDRAGLLSADMSSGSASLAGLLLIAAGLYQSDSAETGLPYPMPLAFRAPDQILAPGRFRTDAGRCGARIILPRMLLDAHGAAVRRRLDERALDRRPCTFGLDREGASSWPSRKPIDRHGAYGLGRRSLIPVDIGAFSRRKPFGPDLCNFRKC